MDDAVAVVYGSSRPQPGSPLSRRLGTRLVEARLVSAADVEAALYEQRHHPGTRLGELLLRMGLLTYGQLMRALAELTAPGAGAGPEPDRAPPSPHPPGAAGGRAAIPDL